MAILFGDPTLDGHERPTKESDGAMLPDLYMWSAMDSGLSMFWLTHPVRLFVCPESIRPGGKRPRQRETVRARVPSTESSSSLRERDREARAPLIAQSCGRSRGRRSDSLAGPEAQPEFLASENVEERATFRARRVSR